MAMNRYPKDRTSLYLGILQILYPKSVWLVATPFIVASGNDRHNVITETEANLSDQLNFTDQVRLRYWVLKVNRLGSTPIRTWKVAPTGLRLTSIHHETGEVKSMVLDAEPKAPESDPLPSTQALRFRRSNPIRLAPLSADQPVFIGLRQSLQPESFNLVSAPEVLSIAEDHDSVISEVTSRYSEQMALSTLCTFKFWVLEACRGSSQSREKWLVEPD